MEASCFPTVLTVSMLITVVTGDCGDNAVGVAEVRKVPDIRLTSSSVANATTTPARNGRLKYTAGLSWCASPCDSNPYLQVDLRSVHIICAVAIQGNFGADQWVKTYQVQYSEDGTGWSLYQENGLTKTFQGNFDRGTVAKQLMYKGFQARYVRVYPKSHYNEVCLRMELYGLNKEGCLRKPIGVSDSAKIPAYRFAASSSFSSDFKPYKARFDSSTGWAPTRADRQKSWLQIDLGDVHVICAIATKGTGEYNSEWAAEYKLRLSVDGDVWNYYQEWGQDKIFPGNNDSRTVKTNVLQQDAQAKFIQFWPMKFKDYPTMRVEIYGVPEACGGSFGMEKGILPASQITATTGTAMDGRLYNSGLAWCGTTLSTAYLQVDLGKGVTLRGLATQGSPTNDNWVTTFIVKYSGDGKTWHDYQENQENQKTFTGNMEREKIRVNWFNYPLSTRYLRVFPQTANGNPCLRMDLYGCTNPTEPSVHLQQKKNTSHGLDSSMLECRINGQAGVEIRWEFGGADITLNSSVVTPSDGSVNGLTISRLPLRAMTIGDVIDQYTCQRFSDVTGTIECTSRPYLCKARYVNGPFAIQTMVIRRSLDVLPPTSVAVTGSQTRSITLEWKEPALLGEAILGYVVKFAGYRTNDKTFLHGGEQTTNHRLPTKLKVTGLLPQTKYQFQIATKVGCGKAVYSDQVQASTKLDEDCKACDLTPTLQVTTLQRNNQGPLTGTTGVVFLGLNVGAVVGIIGTLAVLVLLLIITNTVSLIKLQRIKTTDEVSNNELGALERIEVQSEFHATSRYTQQPSVLYEVPVAEGKVGHAEATESSLYYNVERTPYGEPRMSDENVYDAVG